MTFNPEGESARPLLSFLVPLVSLWFISAGVSCSPLSQQMVGPLREVTIVSEHIGLVEATVRSTLQQPISTPQPEPEFKVRVGAVERFDTFSRFRLLLLIGTSRDTLLRQVLGPRVDSLSDGKYSLFKVPNPWVQGQYALIFVTRDTSLLVPGLAKYALRIRATLRDIVMAQVAQAVYIEGVDRVQTDRLGSRYAFTVDVPMRWRLNEDRASDGFIYMVVHNPDRNVFVHWSDSSRPLVPESLAGLRDCLTGQFYDGDSTDRSMVRAETVAFLAGPAVRLSGVWRNERDVTGGPFVTYALNYQGRFYMIDGLVYNPGKKKLDALAQAEAVVRTFTPR